jgi:hypothetical protein
MFFKNHSANDRLSIWRNLRQKEFNTPEELVLEYEPIKLLSRYIDYYSPKTWPTPFEIVNEGYFCHSGITLLITSHLIHRKFITGNEIHLQVISNNIDGTHGLVLVDNKKVYNFFPGQVTDLENVKENSTIFTTHKLDKNQFVY